MCIRDRPETYELAVSFLQDELQRVADFGITMVVLHPGSHVGAGVEAGTEQIIKGLNTCLLYTSKNLLKELLVKEKKYEDTHITN